ncbi:hypothetical protein RB653_004813 [Dictyostelium firmibasis]|uniref:Rab-GAP TBC domain-containing protein n=1 Tax=Dictyostelium firmibasis TaxID=79012 RepID=A0AAN7Z0G1_9MYCE
MNESREQVIESLVKKILEKASQDDYSYDEWSLSKKQIKELCELQTPNNLRYAVWKHIVQQGDQGFVDNRLTSSNGSNNTSPTGGVNSEPIFHNEMLNRDCLQLSHDYNLISQIKSFNNSSSSYSFDSFSTINKSNTTSILDQSSTSNSSTLLDAPLQPLNASPILNEYGSGGGDGGSGGSTTSSLSSSTNFEDIKNLSTESIAERLSRFIRFFCTKTKREYSIDVAKLMIPFVVLSLVEEMNTLKLQKSSSSSSSSSSPSIIHQNPTEQDWMSLSLKLIEAISNSGIFPYSIANPILLCESEMFRILLLYHDPVLSHFLNQRTVNSMHYFYEWINHMFCGCIDIKFLIQIWDLFLYHNNQDFYIYFALALIISKREATLSLVKGNSKDILQLLEEKNIVNCLSNQIKLPGLVKKAEQLRSCTPLTFIRNWNKLFTYCKHPISPKLDQIKLIYLEYKYAVCMSIDVEELILNSKLDDSQNIKEKFSYYCQDDELQEYPDHFFVFDCRIYKYYKAGKFPGAFHLPPSLLVTQPEEFTRVIQSFSDMKGYTRFTFYDNWQQFNQATSNNNTDADTNENGDMNMNILKFLKEGFPYISKVPSGYKKIHDLFLSKGLELAVHYAENCPVCNPNAFNTLPPSSPITPQSPTIEQTPKERWLSKIRSFRQSTNLTNTTTTNTTTTTTNTSTITTPNPPLQSETNDSSLKSAFSFFKDKLKIRDKSSIYDNQSESTSISNNNLPQIGSGNITATPSKIDSPHHSSLTIGSNRTPLRKPQQPSPKSLIDLDNIDSSGNPTTTSNTTGSILDSNNGFDSGLLSPSVKSLNNSINNNNNNNNNNNSFNDSGVLSPSVRGLDNSVSNNDNGVLSPSVRGLNSSGTNINNTTTNINKVNSNDTTKLNISGNNVKVIDNNNLNNNDNDNDNNSQNNNLITSIWNNGTTNSGSKINFNSTFYLPNLSPFIMDFEEDENEAFEEGKKYYYYIDEKNYPKEAEEFIYDREKIQKEEMEAENEFNKEYKGIEVWLDTCSFMFDCVEQEQKQQLQSIDNNGASTDVNSSSSSISTTTTTTTTTNSTVSTSIQRTQPQNRFIIITDNDIITLKEHPIYNGYVKVDYQYSLNAIQRISYKKNNPNLLEFSFDRDEIKKNSNELPPKDQIINSSESIDSNTSQENIFKKSYIFDDISPILKAINKN